MNLLVAIAELVLAACGLIGGGFAFARFVYKRGGDDRELVKAVNENTTAHHELAISLRDFKDYTVTSLHDLSISHERLAGEVAVIKEQIRKG